MVTSISQKGSLTRNLGTKSCNRLVLTDCMFHSIILYCLNELHPDVIITIRLRFILDARSTCLSIIDVQLVKRERKQCTSIHHQIFPWQYLRVSRDSDTLKQLFESCDIISISHHVLQRKHACLSRDHSYKHTRPVYKKARSHQPLCLT